MNEVQMTMEQLASVMKVISEKAQQDASFRNALLRNPHATIVENFGIQVPETQRLEVHQDFPDKLHVVLSPGQSPSLPYLDGEGILIEQVVKRSVEDAQLRTQFIADPRQTLKAVVGVDVPEDVAVTVLENSASAIHIVIPFLTPPYRDLNDDELDKISGGVAAISPAQQEANAKRGIKTVGSPSSGGSGSSGPMQAEQSAKNGETSSKMSAESQMKSGSRRISGW